MIVDRENWFEVALPVILPDYYLRGTPHAEVRLWVGVVEGGRLQVSVDVLGPGGDHLLYRFVDLNAEDLGLPDDQRRDT